MALSIFSSIYNLPTRIKLLFSNPTTIYVAVMLTAQIALSLGVSVFTPFMLRYLALPSIVERELPLNMVFSICHDQMHGACSFPTATIEYEKNEIFSPSITYRLSARLHFADTDQPALGVFQNVLTMYRDEPEGKIWKQFHRSAYLKEPSSFTKLLWTCFFPLYYLGYLGDSKLVEVPLTDAYVEYAENPTSKLVFALQDRFAQIDRATLVICARFGLVRHLLYYWPITTYAVIFLSCLGGCAVLLAIFWGHRGFQLFNEWEETVRDDNKLNTNNRTSAKTTSAKSTPLVKKRTGFASDEYRPSNTDEVPECVALEAVTGVDATVSDTPKRRMRTGSPIPGVSRGSGGFNEPRPPPIGFERYTSKGATTRSGAFASSDGSDVRQRAK